MSNFAEIISKQLDLIARHNQKLAGMQFALLALAGGADNPTKLITSLEQVKAAVLPGTNPKESELREAIVAQLDELIQHVKDTNGLKGEGVAE